MTFKVKIESLPAEVSLHQIKDEDDLYYAADDCSLTPEQTCFVISSGFSIGKAYLDPKDKTPFIIYAENVKRVGFILLCFWHWNGSQTVLSYFIDKDFQCRNYSKTATKIAVSILKSA